MWKLAWAVEGVWREEEFACGLARVVFARGRMGEAGDAMDLCFDRGMTLFMAVEVVLEA